MILCCLGFCLSKELLRSSEFKGGEIQAAVCGRSCRGGQDVPSVPHPLQEGPQPPGVPGAPPGVAGQGAAMRGSVGARAGAPGESRCYCCWRDKTQQLLGGVQSLG